VPDHWGNSDKVVNVGVHASCSVRAITRIGCVRGKIEIDAKTNHREFVRSAESGI
jgi:hypothetical protein